MREINNDLIKTHADRRFRSEYDYALFEYYRSAKVLAFLDRAGVSIGGRVLDAGCGGGGMPLSLAEHAASVVGIDPIDRFGQAGVVLARERGLTNLTFARADGMALPFADRSFDVVSIAFGLRNVTRKEAALEQMRRVLRPGGVAVVLEFSRVAAPLAPAYDWYSFNVLPRLGRLIANDDASYRYLAESIRVHPDQETLKAMMEQAGFDLVEYHNLTAGVVAVHVGRVY